MMIEIKAKKTGNCGCAFCGRTQAGLGMHPYTVWHKAESEKRGHNDPVCSEYCANGYAELLMAKEEAK